MKKDDNITDGKDSVLKNVVQNLRKSFGPNSIRYLGDDSKDNTIEVIPSGIIGLDKAIGIGGFPKGRIAEIYGQESSGKTTLALELSAQAQKAGGIVAYIDVEHAMDTEYAKCLGININDLLISQPDSGEEALEIVEALVRSSAVSLIVVDSVAALVPKAEIDGQMGDSHVGLQARLMSQALRKLTPAVSQSKTCVLFINQVRQKIGVMYGPNETTSGGLALKFYASLRIEIKKVSQIKSGDESVGVEVKVKIVKNKLSAPYRTADLKIYFGKGVDKIGHVFDLAVNKKVIEQSGSWYLYKDHKLGQGRDKAVEYLTKENLIEEIKELV